MDLADNDEIRRFDFYGLSDQATIFLYAVGCVAYVITEVE
jgi:hypothetical protein